MKAYIIHLFVNCGGAEAVTFDMARVFEGVRVECGELLNISCDYKAIEVRNFLYDMLFHTRQFLRYRRLLLVSSFKELVHLRSDGLVVDTCSNVPVRGVDITYIHYPAVLSTNPSNTLIWRVYEWLIRRKVRELIGSPRYVLANSSWTASKVREVYGINAEVLYPPVDVDYFRYDGRVKEKIIVTISRITYEKKLHILPQIALKLPQYEWYLVGSVGRAGRGVLDKLERGKPKNLHILTNLSRNELRELLLSASFYIHPPFAEHFGIAVAEAAAAGVIPIVYKDGGAWTDIVAPISPELGYGEPEEIPTIIRKLENSRDVGELRERTVMRANQFTTQRFREEFMKIVMSTITH